MAPSPRIPGPFLPPPLSSLTLSSSVACHRVTATEIELFIKATAPSGASAKTLRDEGFERRGEIWFCGDLANGGALPRGRS